jgi:hypothetical protein
MCCPRASGSRGLNQSMVLKNQGVFGTVNANRRHYESAAAYEKHPGDVKTVPLFED